MSSPSAGLAVTPTLAIPLGAKADDYTVGFGAQLSALLALKSLPLVSPRIDLSYDYLPLNLINDSAIVSLIRGSLGIQLTYLFGERLGVYAHAAGGGYYGLLSDAPDVSSAYFSYHAGLGASFQVMNDFSLGIGADYNSFIGTWDGLSVRLTAIARVGGAGGSGVPYARVTPLGNMGTASGLVRVSDVDLVRVFPVLWKYYDANPVGTAVVQNISDEELTNVEIRLEPAAYIDSPKLSARLATLGPGESAEVDLYVLFNEQILSITEGARVVTDVRASYQVGNRQGTDAETVTLETHDRNALTWDIDEKVAAFVTARDDEVNRFARGMAGIAEQHAAGAVPRELRLGMALYAAMQEQGLTYVVDPSSSYAELSENPIAVDSVQFPRQTLYVGAGDCDDLSSTYNALLEAVGINTAFITVPGHIFAAFRLTLSESEARRVFQDVSGLIFRDGSVWIPVETTLLRDGFLQAWGTGARQWRTHDQEGTAYFFPTADAWNVFEPVAFSVSTIELGLPQRSGVESRFASELNSFISRELEPQEAALRGRLSRRPDDPGILNRLGVLYASYGRFDAAAAQFQAALDGDDYVPAIINYANLNYLQEDYRRARRGFEDALHSESDNAAALLGLARCEYELENFGSVRDAYERLSNVAPEVAERFAYLSGGPGGGEDGRALDIVELTRSVAWETE